MRCRSGPTCLWGWHPGLIQIGSREDQLRQSRLRMSATFTHVMRPVFVALQAQTEVATRQLRAVNAALDRLRKDMR